MCLILEKSAGQEVPFNHLLAAAHRNSDGYGVVVQDDQNRLRVIKGLAEPAKAAEEVAKVLEASKDGLAFVHFRYRTVGDINEENLHPIKLLTKDEDGVDAVFLHNGTISGMHSGDNKSDSTLFAETVVAPLARRTARYLGPDEVTSDPLLASILKRYAEGVSKFVIFDGNGQSLVIGRDKGFVQDYGWVSNEYSIKESNIPQPKSTYHVLGKSKKTRRVWEDDHADLVNTLNRQKGGSTSMDNCHPSIRLTVEGITGLAPKHFCTLDPEQVRQMVDDEPDLAAILILDLLYAVYNAEFGKPHAAAA